MASAHSINSVIDSFKKNAVTESLTLTNPSRGLSAQTLFALDSGTLTFDAIGDGPGVAGGLGMTGDASAEDLGTAAATISTDETLSHETSTSNVANENALRITGGATATIDGLDLTKTGDTTDTDASSFYGLNAGLLVMDGASAAVSGAAVTTDATGANGLFSYGENTELIVRDSTIHTLRDASGGLMTAGGAAIKAQNVEVETEGQSSAAIRSDRGGGTVEVEGGTYVTHGTGSTAIYSTADVSVSGATLTATASEGVVVEGKNSVTLKDCELSGTMTSTYGQSSGENLQGVTLQAPLAFCDLASSMLGP